MKILHAIGGLPRSGSTLLCNILNQNPRFYASSTSPLPTAIASLSTIWSHSAEVKGMLIRDRNATLGRLSRAAMALFDAWYAEVEKPVVFDKARSWNYNAALLHSISPPSKLVTISRDLRSITASIERRHVETAVLDESTNLVGKTCYERASFMLGPDGPVGSARIGLEDLIRRNPPNWIHIRYEDLCTTPHEVLAELYQKLGEEPYEHDLGHIENVAEDVDEVWLLKFPHEGHGHLRDLAERDWRGFLSPDVEGLIMEKFSLYNKAFGYEK